MDRIPKTRNGCVIITAVLTQTTLFVKLYNYLLLLVLATILTIIIFNIIILIIAIFLTTIAEKVHLIRQSQLQLVFGKINQSLPFQTVDIRFN